MSIKQWSTRYKVLFYIMNWNKRTVFYMKFTVNREILPHYWTAQNWRQYLTLLSNLSMIFLKRWQGSSLCQIQRWCRTLNERKSLCIPWFKQNMSVISIEVNICFSMEINTKHFIWITVYINASALNVAQASSLSSF